jgi:hypothetical protein
MPNWVASFVGSDGASKFELRCMLMRVFKPCKLHQPYQPLSKIENNSLDSLPNIGKKES